MPKLYTSPFWVPWGGWRSYISSSGAVQSFSEQRMIDEMSSQMATDTKKKRWREMHTCIKRMRVVVFAGRPEASQTVISDFQNKSTVHNTVGRLEIPMAADVVVVKIVHSLVERRAIKCFFQLLFSIQQQKNTIQLKRICRRRALRSECMKKRPWFKDGTGTEESLWNYA